MSPAPGPATPATPAINPAHPGHLVVAMGQASMTGRRGANEDFVSGVTPEGSVLQDKGVALAVADGVGKGRGGRAAAELAVRRFLSDYYSSPDTWSVLKRLEQTLSAVNQSVREHETSKGGAATFVSLVVRGNRAFVAHVGDARAYLLRGNELRCLTEDHIWQHPDLRNVVSRAVGLDVHLHPEYHQEAVQAGDVFLLCTDGLYKTGHLSAQRIRTALRDDLQTAAESLAQSAIEAGSDDDVSLMILRIDALPSVDSRSRNGETLDLPLLDEVREGLTLDDFYLAKRLHKGQLSEVFLADDLRSGRKVVLKFPRVEAASPEAMQVQIDGFLREEWVGRRIQNRHVQPALMLEPGRRTRLYYATPYTPGETLRRRLDKGMPLAASEAVEYTIQTAKGLEALHRLQVLHRDIKPDNILIDDDGKAVLLDLGVAQTESFNQEEAAPGTPSYMAPEFFRGERTADERTEVYALGVTLYELVTRKFPYGEIEPFSQPRFNRLTPPSRYNPEIPFWLETVIQKAVEADPAKRFQALSEMRFHLERRERVHVEDAPRRTASGAGKTLVVWKVLTCFFAVIALLEFLLILSLKG